MSASLFAIWPNRSNCSLCASPNREGYIPTWDYVAILEQMRDHEQCLQLLQKLEALCRKAVY